MKIKIKLRHSDLLLALLWFSVFPFQLPGKSVYFLQFIFGSIILVYSFKEYKKMPYFFFVILFPCVIFISCLINRNAILFTQVARGGTYSILIIDAFLFTHLYARKRGKEKLIDNLYIMAKVYFIVSTIGIFWLLFAGTLNDSAENLNLVLGGKFNTAYMMIIFLILFYSRMYNNKVVLRKREKQTFCMLACICIWVCFLLQVSTGMVAIVFLTVLIIIPNDFYKMVNNPLIVTSLIIGSMVVVFFISAILTLPIVQKIIVNVLHENLSLTGRTELYQLLYPLLLKSGLWGGGFGSYKAMQLGYHGWYNAQNGLAEIILTYGYMGALTFLIMVFFCALKNKSNYKAINIGIITFIVVAIIEVPFDVRFVFLLSIFATVGKMNKKN